jgi:hypothetical protein
MNAASLSWWERPWVQAAAIMLSAVPLLWPDIPPLTDLPGHMARYRIELDLAQSPSLQRFYDFQWALIGNLGIDLLVIPLGRLLGLEAAVKLIVLLIPPLTAAGFLWVAREVHGRIPPTALFTLPLAYNYPFVFGFANFALSMALAMLAFGLWLRLGRLGHVRLRAGLFVPISVLLWFTHAFGWGTLGVLAFAAEVVRVYDRERSLTRALVRAVSSCLVLALPMVLMLAWRSGAVAGETADWFNLKAKVGWLAMALRDRWAVLDVTSVVVLALLLFEGWRHPRLEYSRMLGISALFLAAVYLLLPRIVFGSAYADMRLAPYLLAIAILAIRTRDDLSSDFARRLAAAAILFFLVRTVALTASFALYDRDYDRELAALDHLPRGARVVAFTGVSCGRQWQTSRLEHLPGLAVVRREAFSNDQWVMAGAQLLTVRYPAGGGFVADPSQMVIAEVCPGKPWRTLDEALRRIPRDAFDYVWLIAPPRHNPSGLRGMTPVWRDGTSVLYRISQEGGPLSD